MSDFNALDLDSLDALLDAAEVDIVMDESNSAPDPVDAMDESSPTQANEGDIPIDEGISETVEAAAEPMISESIEETPSPSVEVPQDEAMSFAATEDTDAVAMSPLNGNKVDASMAPELNEQPTRSPPELRTMAKPNETTWTDAEMDSLKKLIIIFGSILIVLTLSAIGVSMGSLLSTPKADPELIEKVDSIKTDVGQSYLMIEASGKQAKAMTDQLADVVSQLSEISAAIEVLKTKPVAVAPTSAKSGAERKAALRSEDNGQASADNARDVPPAPKSDDERSDDAIDNKGEKSANNVQEERLSADITDVKKRLIATQKVLETIQKQSEALQQQSQLLNDSVKAVETEVKALKPPVKVSSVHKVSVVAKKAEEKVVSPEPVAVPVKPADDPEWRARWSQQMGKSDGFP